MNIPYAIGLIISKWLFVITWLWLTSTNYFQFLFTSVTDSQKLSSIVISLPKTRIKCEISTFDSEQWYCAMIHNLKNGNKTFGPRNEMLRRAINSDINEDHYTKRRSKQHHCTISN